jgi:hypothetical protein
MDFKRPQAAPIYAHIPGTASYQLASPVATGVIASSARQRETGFSQPYSHLTPIGGLHERPIGRPIIVSAITARSINT